MNLRLELHFNDSTDVRLQRTVLESSLLPRRLISVRGKNAWGLSSTGSFEWSSAVRAMSLLFLETLIQPGFLLRSEAASSLDYALSRKPQWLSEMFGISGSINFCNRIFKRVYKDSSRHAALKINEDLLNASAIQVYLNGRPADDIRQLSYIRNRIQSDYPAFKSARKLIDLSLRDEVNWGLSRPDIISADGQRGFAKYLSKYRITEKLGGYRIQNFLSDYKSPNLIGQSRENLTQSLNQFGITSVEVPVLAPTAAAILYRIKSWGVYLDIRYQYSTSYWFVRELLRGSIRYPPELVVLGVVPLMNLMNSAFSREYQLLMPLGVQSGWVASMQGADSGKVCYFADEPSNLILVDENTSSVARHTNATTAEILSAVVQQKLDSRAALFSPFGYIAREMGANASRVCGEGYSAHPFFLLARKDIASSPKIKLIEQAVVRAWSEVIFDQRAAVRAVSSMLSDNDFCSQLVSEGGLHQLSSLC